MFRTFCEKINFPEDAIKYLESLLPIINKNEKILEKITNASNLISNKNHPDAQLVVKEIATELEISEYTIWVYVLVKSAIKAHELYKQKNIPDEIYYASMKDLTYKLIECKKVHNVWGIFVAHWYPGFFTCDRFCLGRLQFERRLSPFDYKNYCKKDQLIYGCHIPSSGPLILEDVIESLKKAYEFYNVKNGEYLILNCHSWLLYKPLVNLFKETSNVRKFYDLFDVVDKHETKIESDGWRIFDTLNLSDLTALPEKTSLQQNVKKYLLDGNALGAGNGMLVFDGENIINK